MGLGYVVTPGAVPIYDGVSQPDEPYRYVSPPTGAKSTPAATSAIGRSPVAAGESTSGLTLATSETGPQFSLYLPRFGLKTAGPSVQVKVTPKAPTDQPAGARLDGNVYEVAFVAPTGPATLTAKAALATLYLRATTSRQPGPVMEHRSGPGQPWKALQTSRGGLDVYVSSLVGAGDYALAFPSRTTSGGGFPVLPVALGAGVVVLAGVVLVLRRRAPQA